MGIWNAIPLEWKDMIHADKKAKEPSLLKIYSVNTKIIRGLYVRLNTNENLLIKKVINWNINYKVNLSIDDYKHAVMNVDKITISMKLRSFQLRLLYNAITTNVQLKNYQIKDTNCRGITRIHRSPSRPRPSMRPTAAFINIHEHLI